MSVAVVVKIGAMHHLNIFSFFEKTSVKSYVAPSTTAIWMVVDIYYVPVVSGNSVVKSIGALATRGGVHGRTPYGVEGKGHLCH